MARYWCKRCKQELNTLDPELHLCKDIKRRYERFEANVKIVEKILKEQDLNLHDHNFRDVAAAIVTGLSNRGIDKETIDYGD